MSLRLALAQINTTVGDLEGNKRKIESRIREAAAAGADLVVFPELAIPGYPPEDLLLKPGFLRACRRTLEELAPASRGLTAVVGTVAVEADLYNAAAILHDGTIAGLYRKQYLPNYGVFDENRYFKAGGDLQVFSRGGATLGISICEDIWYPDGPAACQATWAGAELLINLSSSPFHRGKANSRERMLATRATDAFSYVAFCNLVGGQDELVFDGRSVVIDPGGKTLARAAQFEEELLLVDLEPRDAFRRRLHEPRSRKSAKPASIGARRTELADLPAGSKPSVAAKIFQPLDAVPEVYQALVLGTRDYITKNGFQHVVLGLSGGIDSALTAAIAADAIGPDRVTVVAMPSRYSSPESLEDAQQVAGNLGLNFLEIPIDRPFQSYLDLLQPVFAGRKPDLAEENLQARIRGTLLMALSNKFGWLVVTTGNKSEVGVGYTTLYGDSAGGFAVIKDVPKTLVYELSRWRNAQAGRPVIPQRVLDKAPTAELRPNQKDSDSLPEYSVLDPILHAYVEENCDVSEIVQRGFDEATVRKVILLVDRSEYKRRQSPPGVKITPRAFGKDWRLPITNRYLDNGAKRG